MKYDRPIHELLRDCAHDLREPFTVGEVVRWFASRYPDVAASAVRAHVQAMTGNVPNRAENHPHLGSRPPVLRRVARGQYARWTGSAMGARESAEISTVRPVIEQNLSSRSDDVTEDWFWEGNIQSRLLTYLFAEGYHVLRVADTRSREGGTDVIARREGRLLHVEVKGWPSSRYRDPAKAHLAKPTLAATQARVWFNDAVVHALRLRDAHVDEDVAMCLPDQGTYRNLLRGVGLSLTACRIGVLLIDERGQCSPWVHPLTTEHP